MPAAEIAAAVTGIRSALDITKAMINLRDEEAFRNKSIELRGVVLDTLEKAIEAREEQSKQLDRIRELEAEVARLKAWEGEKQRYELKPIGRGAVARVLKPDERGTETPHWLCPNCFEQSRKAYLQSTNKLERGNLMLSCVTCRLTAPASTDVSKWPQD
jgi:hypothetical protein